MFWDTWHDAAINRYYSSSIMCIGKEMKKKKINTWLFFLFVILKVSSLGGEIYFRNNVAIEIHTHY